MVQAQMQLVTQGLGIKHLRLVMGNSMGGNYSTQPRSVRFANLFYALGTNGMARFYKEALQQLLQTAPRLAP